MYIIYSSINNKKVLFKLDHSAAYVRNSVWYSIGGLGPTTLRI